MKQLNPSLEDTFQKNLDYFSELEELLIETVKNHQNHLFINKKQHIEIAISELKKVHPQKLILFELFRPFGFNITTIQNLINCLNGESGRQFFSDTHCITVDREYISLKTKAQLILREQVIKPEQDEAIIGNYHLSINKLANKPSSLITEPHAIYVDADELIYPLKLRAWREGDSFRPFGEGERLFN
jgi:tRNA(Ile)-lysidine synthase